MSKFAKLSRLVKRARKTDVLIKRSARTFKRSVRVGMKSDRVKLIKGTLALGAVGGIAGRVSGGMVSQAGLQKPARKKGMKWGAVAGASVALAPSAGKIVFRKIRGRIIPILKKF